MKTLYFFLISCFCVGIVFAQSDIASVEYFIDADPGVGLATSIDIDPDVEIIDQNFNISTSGLSIGVHRLFIRAINVDGDTSLYEHKTFYVTPSPEVNTFNITDAEYFFDQDPGVGSATVIDLTDSGSIDESLTVSTSSLSIGIHRLFVRVKNSDDEWSLFEHKTFYVAPIPEVNTFDIVKAEFFIDADPGVGIATSLTVSGNIIDENFVIPTSGSLADGTHYLYIRTQNSDGQWSLYERQEFEIDGVLGVDNVELKKISIYPNPASSVINISLPSDNKTNSVVIYDLNGGEIYNDSNEMERIDISTFSNGVYLLIVSTDKGNISRKIVKI